MTEKRVMRGAHDLIQESLPIYSKGDGLTAREVAEKLGVTYVSSNNPNTTLINALADFYTIEPSGGEFSGVINSSNGGIGIHEYTKNLYNEVAIKEFKKYIQAKIKEGKPKDGVYKLCKKRFRAKEGYFDI